MGFVPPPDLGLLSGHLYNIVICLLSAAALLWPVWLLGQKEKRGWRENSFALFLFCLGGELLLIAGANLAGFLHATLAVTTVSYFIQLLSVVTPLPLIVYLVYDIAENKLSARLTVLPFALLAGLVLFVSVTDPLAAGATYWGTQCLLNHAGRGLLFSSVFLPIILATTFMIFISSGKRREITPYLAIIVYLLLETFNQLTLKLDWYHLLQRGGYFFIGLSAYLYFVRGEKPPEPFVPADAPPPAGARPRRPLFTKLLFLFILLSIIPISIAALLMFLSFKEIIDVYIYKPLLWNLKTTREEFLVALRNSQLQAGSLLALTVVLVLAATVAASRAVADSLRRVIMGMRRVADGDFSFKLRPESNDEIGDVVDYFNDMSQEIKRARDVMENWNRELEVKVAERTEDLRTLFDIARAIGSSLDLELLIRQTMKRIGVENFALLNPDLTVRFSGGSAQNRRNALQLPIRAKGQVIGTLVLDASLELAQKESLLTTITDQLAIALENIGIYEKEKEAVARLTELDRLKNEFISMVSHELRTPVTSADGYVSLFLAGVTGALSDDQKKYLTIVKENNQRLLTLINRLLDFSQIETGRFSIKRELVSINEVVNAAVEIMRPQIEKKNAALTLKLEAQNVNFMGDREKMLEVFINLIENALKFAREGEPLKIGLFTRDADDFLKVAVVDNGIGIAAPYLEKVFNKFYQIEDAMTRKVGGVGLGLTLAREIIGNHHGRIWAESAGQGQGAKFIFELPVAERV